ncbi:MAG: phosphodiester glycosidase family protein [Chloroflexota bacterium]|nr:MAG: hypothetical protein DIU80_19830 [Chloroflexota bacterium]
MTRPIPNWTLLLLVAVLSLLALLSLGQGPQAPILSAWPGALDLGRQTTGAIIGEAAPIVGEAVAVPPGTILLEQYNQASVLQDSAAGGSVRFFRRELAGGGSLAYFVVMLDEQTRVRIVNADGATPTSDPSGDTIWAGGGLHLATVQEMVNAPYAARPGETLLGATNFGFFGARTSSEGTVMIDGQVLRVNPWRAAVCVTRDARAMIGLFNEQQLIASGCEQAFGAGPVFLWNGKIVNPEVASEDSEFIPFNPLGENFTQLQDRIRYYMDASPKTVVGIGTREDGRSFLVLATSVGVPGIELARHLRGMGCTAVLGADSGSSTQMVWRGAPLADRPPREVADALAVYVAEP